MGTRGRLSIRVCGRWPGRRWPRRPCSVPRLPPRAPRPHLRLRRAVRRRRVVGRGRERGQRQAAVEPRPDTERPMASITKVMTAFLVITAGHLDHRSPSRPPLPGTYATQRQQRRLHPGESSPPASCSTRCCCRPAPTPPTPWPRPMARAAAFVARRIATARLSGKRRTHSATSTGWPTRPRTRLLHRSEPLVLGGRRCCSRSPARSSPSAGFRFTAPSRHHACRWKNLDPLIGREPAGSEFEGRARRSRRAEPYWRRATRNAAEPVVGVALRGPVSISTINVADATRILNSGLQQSDVT